MSSAGPPSDARGASEQPRNGRRSCAARVVLWIVPPVCLVLILLARMVVWPRDHATSNVLTLALAVVGGGSLLGWFFCFSPFSRRARLTAAALLAGAAVLALTTLKVEQVTGELLPSFTWRWSKAPDERLSAPARSKSGDVVDLLSTTAFDFPQFLGPKRDAAYQAVTLFRNWAARPPKLLWRQPIGAGWSAFAAVNGFAITMEQRSDEELVACYEVMTGRLRWSHSVRARHETTLGGIGPRSTPTIDQGKVYAMGATGVLRCLDGATGAEIWSRDIPREMGLTAEKDLEGVAWGRAASPLIVDQLVVTPYGGTPKKGPYVSLAAYDKDSGAEVWRGGNRQISYSSPAEAVIFGVRQILIVNEDTVSAHEPATGATLWDYPWPGSSTSSASTSQAVAFPERRVLLSKGYTGGGAELLQIRRSPDGRFSAEPAWRNAGSLKTKFTNVAVADGCAYALSDGVLECVRLDTGLRAWRGGRYGHGQVLRVGDLLVVQAETGLVAMVEASPQRYLELGRFQAIEGKTWNNPSLYGPYLLVRNALEAACYELPLREP